LSLVARLAAVGLEIGAAAVLGRLLLRPLERGLSRAERWAWALAGGLAAVAALDGLLLAARVRSAPLTLGPLVLAAAGAAALLCARRAAPAKSATPPAGSPTGRILYVLGALAIVLFAFEAVAEPMWSNDFLAIWGFKGKTIWAASAVPARLFHDPAAGWSHPEYPLLLPFTMASLASLRGAWDDQALALLFPALALGTALAASGFLSRLRGRGAGAVGFFLVATFFPLYRPFLAGMAEIPLALALLLAATAFLDLRDSTDGPALARAALASLLCAATKREGAVWVFLLASALLLGGTRRGARRALSALAFAVPAAVHGIGLRLARGPVADRDFDFGLLAPARLPELLGRIGALGDLLLRRAVLPMALPLSLAAFFFLVSRRGGTEALLPPLGAQIAVYAIALAFCRFGAAWLLEVSLGRIVSALFPVAALILASRFDAAWVARNGNGPSTRRMETA
jgi:hypothetical protein